MFQGWPDTCVQYELGQMRNALANTSEEGQGANVSTCYACIFVLAVHVKSVLLQNLVAAIRENICPVDNVRSDFKYISHGTYFVVY